MLKSMGVLLLASGEAGFDLNRKEKRKREKDEEKRRMRLRVLKWLVLQLPGWRHFKRGVWEAENWGPFSFGFSSKFSFEFSVCEHWNWGIAGNSHCWKCRFSNFPFSWKCFCLSNSTEEFSYLVLDESYKNQQRHSFREGSTNFLPYLYLCDDTDHYQSFSLAQVKSIFVDRQN